MVRGGNRFGDQPRAVGGPHLDYYQGDPEREAFHKVYRENIISYHVFILVVLQEFSSELPGMNTSVVEARLLMGLEDTKEHKLGVLLGIWKPLSPAAVCDYPLAVMDARHVFLDDNLLSRTTIHN